MIYTSLEVNEVTPFKGAEETHARKLRSNQYDRRRANLMLPKRRRLHELGIWQNQILWKLFRVRS